VTEPPAIGCLHIAAAVDSVSAAVYFPPSYPAPADDVRAALDRVAGRVAAGDPIQVVTLGRRRRENGVLVVVGTRRTIQPATPRTAYYVYDQARDEAFIAESLVPRLGIPGLTAEGVSAAARMQLGTSLRLVAPGQPVFLVDADGATPQVVHAGQVEAVFPANET
jgi:hypothetical protein